MRSNRPNYASTPAGSAKALDQKPKPKRSKREINQLMLMLFLLFFPFWGCWRSSSSQCAGCLCSRWWPQWPQCGLFTRSFFPGRMILTAVYGLLTVFTLINALTASRTSSIRPAQTMLVPTPVPAATDVPFASYGTMGTSVPRNITAA